MNYARFLLTTIYAICLAGWGAVWVADQLNVVWLLLALAALVIGYVSDRRGRHLLKPSWNRMLLVTGLSLAVVDWRWGSGSWFLALVLLLMYVIAVRALSPKANRDLMQMIGLSFLELLAASVLTLNLGYAVFFLIYFVLAPWSLLAVAAKAELEGEQDILRGAVAGEGPISVPAGAERMLGRGVLASMTVAIALTMVVNVLFFLSFPRLNTGRFAGRLGLQQPISGLSEEVRLGEVGTILTNSEPAARVVLEEGPRPEAGTVYLRGIALDRFDGERWSNTLDHERLRRPHGRFALDPRSDLWQPTHRFRVLLEDLGTDLLLTVPQTLQVEVERDRLHVDGLGTVRLPNQQGGVRYELVVDGRDYWQPDLPWGRLRAPPRETLTPQLRAMTRLPQVELPAAIGARAAEPDLDWVRRAIDEFQSWTYTLEQPDAGRPLDDFFERRAGHCELFATSLALMLRAAGVPAVVVNGFRGGEWMLDDRYLLVRQRNAHSWVEAYLPGAGGWVPLDPTPGLPDPEGLWVRTVEAWQAVADRAWFLWMDYVVAYDLGHQKDMVDETQERARALRQDTRAWSRELRAWLKQVGPGLGSVVGAVLIGLGLAVAWWLWRRGRGPRRRSGHVFRTPPPWLRRLLKDLERRYGARPQHLPLATWAERLPASGPVRSALRSFVVAYDAWRFGEAGSEEALRRRAAALRKAVQEERQAA